MYEGGEMTVTEIETIYKDYFRDIYLYILGLSGDEHIAEDVTEETFFRAMKALPEFRGDCDVRVWLCQIAKNQFYSYVRKNKKSIPTDFSEMDEEPSLQMSEETSIEKQLVDSEMAEIIHRKVHELAEPYKEVFYLRVFGELSFEKIGALFGKNANWACVTYHRAKTRIQNEMENLK